MSAYGKEAEDRRLQADRRAREAYDADRDTVIREGKLAVEILDTEQARRDFGAYESFNTQLTRAERTLAQALIKLYEETIK